MNTHIFLGVKIQGNAGTVYIKQVVKSIHITLQDTNYRAWSLLRKRTNGKVHHELTVE